MKEKISIIIPCYNVADYIGKCLDSVLAQTYQNIEVICVNDGSEDDTAIVLDVYAKKDVRVKVIHKENGGVTSARFVGLNVATGDWIGFVDGDDIVDVDMYERLMANITEEMDISHCGYKKLFPQGEIEYYYNSGRKELKNGNQGIEALLSGSFEPGIWNKIYRKNLFVGLQDWLDASIKINEDLLMNFYLFRKARNSVYEDFCPYYYMVRKGSASASQLNENKLYDPIKVLDILDKETKEDVCLNAYVKNRIAYLLIDGSTRNCKYQKELTKPFVKSVRKRLKASYKEIKTGAIYSKKIKLSALWVRIWPASYRWVHSFYFKRNKKYKKYKEIYPWL